MADSPATNLSPNVHTDTTDSKENYAISSRPSTKKTKPKDTKMTILEDLLEAMAVRLIWIDSMTESYSNYERQGSFEKLLAKCPANLVEGISNRYFLRIDNMPQLFRDLTDANNQQGTDDMLILGPKTYDFVDRVLGERLRFLKDIPCTRIPSSLSYNTANSSNNLENKSSDDNRPSLNSIVIDKSNKNDI